MVEAALKDDGLHTLPDTFFAELELKLPTILEGRAEKLEAECVAIVLEGREELGLLGFDSINTKDEDSAQPSSAKGSDVPSTECSLRAASTTFAGHSFHYNTDMSFQKVMDLFFKPPYPDNVRYGRQPLSWRPPQFQKTFAKDAEKVLEGLGLPLNVTFEHMNGIASSLRCNTCSHHYNYQRSWTGWVCFITTVLSDHL